METAGRVRGERFLVMAKPGARPGDTADATGTVTRRGKHVVSTNYRSRPKSGRRAFSIERSTLSFALRTKVQTKMANSFASVRCKSLLPPTAGALVIRPELDLGFHTYTNRVN